MIHPYIIIITWFTHILTCFPRSNAVTNFSCVNRFIMSFRFTLCFSVTPDRVISSGTGRYSGPK